MYGIFVRDITIILISFVVIIIVRPNVNSNGHTDACWQKRMCPPCRIARCCTFGTVRSQLPHGLKNEGSTLLPETFVI